MLPKGSISKVSEYYFTASKYEDDIMRSLREFFDRPDLDSGGSLQTTEKGEAFFNEWFFYDFVLSNGYTVLEDFIATNPFKLQNSEMELYKNLLDNKYSVFEVLDIQRGKSITVKDLQTDKLTLLQEFKGTFCMEKGYVFLARVGRVADHYELIGAESFSMTGIDDAAKKSFRNEKIKFTPKVANEILNRQRSF